MAWTAKPPKKTGHYWAAWESSKKGVFTVHSVEVWCEVPSLTGGWLDPTLLPPRARKNLPLRVSGFNSRSWTMDDCRDMGVRWWDRPLRKPDPPHRLDGRYFCTKCSAPMVADEEARKDSWLGCECGGDYVSFDKLESAAREAVERRNYSFKKNY